MRWHDIVTRFNQEFAGKILPGSSNPRQARTHVALRTERSRIKKITDHTGIPLKSQRVTAEVDETDDEEESDDEMDLGQPYPTRRGDPPPGKPPRRDDDDDQQGGGVGGLEPARDLVMT